MIESVGRTVRLFLVEGKPTGLVTAEVMNWTGHIVAAPRSSLAALLSREEARRTGVYLLVDDDTEQFGLPTVYVGESDNVAVRIKTHDAQREFGRVCLITSKDANLTKAHVLYLESRLIEMAKDSGRATLDNARASDNRSLPESDRADMEYFLQQVELVLPVVGFDLLRPTRRTAISKSVPVPIRTNDGLALFLSPLKHPGLANSVESDGEITVLLGSRATTDPYPTNHYAALRKQLIDDGRLAPIEGDPNYLIFTQDVPFKSPSAASSVILNRNSNGRLEWKLNDGTGRSLKEYQDEQLASVVVTDNAADGGDGLVENADTTR